MPGKSLPSIEGSTSGKPVDQMHGKERFEIRRFQKIITTIEFLTTSV